MESVKYVKRFFLSFSFTFCKCSVKQISFQHQNGLTQICLFFPLLFEKTELRVFEQKGKKGLKKYFSVHFETSFSISRTE